MKKFTKIASLIFIVISASLFFMPRNQSEKHDPAVVSNNYATYIVTSPGQTDYTRYEIYYPPVSVLPGTFKYKLLPIYEKYQMQTKEFEPLFFATKRVNELVTWANIVSWEELLKRYQTLIDRQISMTEQVYDPSVREAKYEEIKRHIVQHREKLQQTIATSTLSNERRLSVSTLVTSIFLKYEKELNIQPHVDSEEHDYSLDTIIKNEDFGEYIATVDSADVPFDRENFSMQFDDTTFTPEYEPFNEKSGIFKFPAFGITDQSKKTVSLHKPQKTEDVFVEVIPSAEEKQTYFYTDITELLPYGESEVRMNEGNQFAVVSLENYVSSPSALLDAISKNNQTLKKAGDEYEYVMKNYLEKEKRFYLVTEHPGDEIFDQSMPTTISIRYVTPPKLQLQKIAHTNGYVTTSQQEKTTRNFPIAVLSLILGTVGLLFPLIKRVKFSRRILPFVKKHSYVLLGVSIVYVIFEVFILKRQIDIIDLVIGFIFLMIAYVRKWEAFFFHATFTFLILSLVLFFLQKEIFRMTADWMFLMFVFFIIDLILQRRSK